MSPEKVVSVPRSLSFPSPPSGAPHKVCLRFFVPLIAPVPKYVHLAPTLSYSCNPRFLLSLLPTPGWRSPANSWESRGQSPDIPSGAGSLALLWRPRERERDALATCDLACNRVKNLYKTLSRARMIGEKRMWHKLGYIKQTLGTKEAPRYPYAALSREKPLREIFAYAWTSSDTIQNRRSGQ